MNVVRRWLDRLSFVGVSSGVFLWGFVQGHYALTFRVEFAFAVLVVVLLQAVISSIMFAGFISLSTATFLWSLLRGSGPAPVESGPSVTALVPVYRDENVLHRSVESLLDSEYDDLQIRIVCEPDDEASIERARELAEVPSVDYIVNTGSPGSKAGAINYAADMVDTDLVAVFDADEVVHPEFVGRAVAKLDDCDVVQGRTVPQPEGFVEELAYYESVLLSYVGRRLLYLVTDFKMAASRAVVMRSAVLDRVGGYDETMLTEDFDFAYECYKHRVEVEECLAAPSKIEAAHSLRDWWGQRKRWMTGYAQTLHKLVAEVRPVTDYRNLLSAAICASTVVGSLLMLSLLSKFVVLFLAGAQGLFLLPIVVVMSATAAVRLVDRRAGVIESFGYGWALVPLVVPLYSLTAIKAVIEYLFSWDGDWYSVEKGTPADA